MKDTSVAFEPVIPFEKMGWRKNNTIAKIAAGLTTEQFDAAMSEALFLTAHNKGGTTLAEYLQEIIEREYVLQT